MPNKIRNCINCRQSKPYFGDGRCQACYQYKRRNGRERPADYFLRDRVVPKNSKQHINFLEKKLEIVFNRLQALEEERESHVYLVIPKAKKYASRS